MNLTLLLTFYQSYVFNYKPGQPTMDDKIVAFEGALKSRRAQTQERIDRLDTERLTHTAAIPGWVRTMHSIEDETAYQQRVMQDCAPKDSSSLKILLRRAEKLEWLIQSERMRQQAVEHLRVLGDRSMMQRFEQHTAAIGKIEGEIKKLREDTGDKEYAKLKQVYEKAKRDLIDCMQKVTTNALQLNEATTDVVDVM